MDESFKSRTFIQQKAVCVLCGICCWLIISRLSPLVKFRQQNFLVRFKKWSWFGWPFHINHMLERPLSHPPSIAQRQSNNFFFLLEISTYIFFRHTHKRWCTTPDCDIICEHFINSKCEWPLFAPTNMLVLNFLLGNWICAVRPKDHFDWFSSQSFHPCSKNRKLRNKPSFVYWKYIKWLTRTLGRFFRSVCKLEFQAYGHGNFYQYSKAIEDGGGIQKRASAVKQRSKSSGLTHAHQTVCRLSQSLNGTKSKVVDASG